MDVGGEGELLLRLERFWVALGRNRKIISGQDLPEQQGVCAVQTRGINATGDVM